MLTNLVLFTLTLWALVYWSRRLQNTHSADEGSLFASNSDVTPGTHPLSADKMSFFSGIPGKLKRFLMLEPPLPQVASDSQDNLRARLRDVSAQAAKASLRAEREMAEAEVAERHAAKERLEAQEAAREAAVAAANVKVAAEAVKTAEKAKLAAAQGIVPPAEGGTVEMMGVRSLSDNFETHVPSNESGVGTVRKLLPKLGPSSDRIKKALSSGGAGMAAALQKGPIAESNEPTFHKQLGQRVGANQFRDMLAPPRINKMGSNVPWGRTEAHANVTDM